jgi:FkbM family methyltransferase
MQFWDSPPGRIVSRVRALYRALRGVGPSATFQLVRRRVAAAFGQTNRAIYEIKVPGYPNPIKIRGGNGSDGYAFYQHLAIKDFDILNDLVSPRLMIDAGANIGMASLYFLNRYPGLRIVAIEPDPDTFEICRMNLAPYRDRVVLIKGAIWSTCGQVVLAQGELEWNTHVKPVENGAAQNGADGPSVQSYDVPALIAAGGGGMVDFLKVDIEGGELELFGKNTELWLPAIKNIAIEFHGDECEKTFFRALKGYEYDGFPYRTVTVCQNVRSKDRDAEIP